MVTRKIASLQQSMFSELGEAWIQDGLVNEEALYDVLASHSDSEQQFLAIREHRLLPEATLLQDLASTMACPFWDEASLRAALTPQIDVVGTFPKATLEKLCVLPLSLKDGNLQVAISSWPSQEIFTTLQQQVTATNVVFGFAERASIMDVISYAFAQNNGKTQAVSSVNADLFDDSWDDWEALPSSSSQAGVSQSSQANMSRPSQAGMPVPAPSTPSSDGSVDDLLANFLTPDEPMPSASSGVFQGRSSADSFARSLPAVDAASGSQASIPSTPKILSGSSSSLPSGQSSGSVTGLAALQQARSGSEWQSGNSSSILGAAKSSASLPQGPAISSMNAPGIMAADVAEARKDNATKRQKKSKKKADAANANIMAFVMTIVRILVACGIAYLIYQGYQNGI